MSQNRFSSKARALLVSIVVFGLILPGISYAAASSGTQQIKSQPRTLVIPKLNVKAKIVQVGILSNGIMQSPARGADVGWYKQGPLPGQPGNAVMSGHVDSRFGREVFWNLKSLKPGDTLSVVNNNGSVKRFRVTKVGVYPFNQAPLKLILGPSRQVHLNLVTCAGRWSRAKHNYSHRLVVFTELV